MPNFMFAYHGGKRPESPEEGEKVMAAWGAWMEKHKAALVDPGNPVGASSTVSPSGISNDGGANPLAGYSVISADSMEAACAIASDNPMLSDGGSVEVAEIMPM